MLFDDDMLLPAEGRAAGVARALYHGVRDLAYICPHGHTDPSWFARNEPFGDLASLLIIPDHYIFRMLVSQGMRFEDLTRALRAIHENGARAALRQAVRRQS